MFHSIYRKVSKFTSKPRYRRCIVVDETRLRVKKVWVYVWSADVDSRGVASSRRLLW